MSIIFPAYSSIYLSSPSYELKRLTWKEISDISRSGKAKDYFSLGDEKPFKIGDETHIARIVDFDNISIRLPTVYGRQFAGITFDIKNVFVDPIPQELYSKHKSDIASNYMTSPIRTSTYMTSLTNEFLHTSIFPNLTESMQNSIANISHPISHIYEKHTLVNSGYSKKLFIPSLSEYVGYLPYEKYSDRFPIPDGVDPRFSLYKKIPTSIEKTKLNDSNTVWYATPTTDLKYGDIGVVTHYGRGEFMTNGVKYEHLNITFAFCV